MSEESDICYVCLRIGASKILMMAHQVWKENPKVAREIGLKAIEIIERAYKENRLFFCGHSSAGLIGGLFFILGKASGMSKTQRKIAEILGVSDVTTYKSVKRWSKEFDWLPYRYERKDHKHEWKKLLYAENPKPITFYSAEKKGRYFVKGCEVYRCECGSYRLIYHYSDGNVYDRGVVRKIKVGWIKRAIEDRMVNK